MFQSVFLAASIVVTVPSESTVVVFNRFQTFQLQLYKAAAAVLAQRSSACVKKKKNSR